MSCKTKATPTPLSPSNHEARKLPPTLSEICDVVGFDVTLKIAEYWGGKRLYFPKRVLLTGELAQVVGLDAANQLSWAFGGWQFEVPICRTMRKAARDRAIRADAQTMTRNELSQKYNLALRALRQIINQAPENPETPGLDAST